MWVAGQMGRSRANIQYLAWTDASCISDATIDEIITDYIDHLNIPSSMHLSFDASTSDWVWYPTMWPMNWHRIVQESMNNILKYSSGTQISISLLMDGAHVRLEIFSNGVMKRSSSKASGCARWKIGSDVWMVRSHVTADETGVRYGYGSY